MSESQPVSMRGAVDLASLAQQQQPAEPSLTDVVIDGGERELDEFARRSTQVPVLVEMHRAAASSPDLAEVVRAAQGRLVLLRIDIDANPQFGSSPQVLALLGGRPAPLFAGGVPPRAQLVQVVSEVLAVAQQQGITGTVQVAGEAAAPQPTVSPEQQEAAEALRRGDIAAAKAVYERVLAEKPADEDARVGLAQVRLLERLRGKTLEEIRARAAAAPLDIDAQFDVADLDISGGHVEDAFARLMRLYPQVDDTTRVRERLVELFDVVGAEDARVRRARQQLASLLFA